VPIVTSLSSADLRGALAAAGTWHEATTVSELATTAVETLHEIVPCDGVGWNEVDLQGHEVRAVTSPAEYFVPETIDALQQWIGQHPIVSYVARTGDHSATKISDFVTTRELHRLDIYSDFFRVLGVEDLLAVIIQAEPVIIGIAFTRGGRTYQERDRELLNLLRPHLASAYRNVAARIDAQQRLTTLERGLDGRDVVPLEADGRIAFSSPLVQRWFGSAQTIAPGRYERDDAYLTVHFAGGDPPLLLLDEHRHAPDPERLRRLGLTSREGEVVALAGRGLTDAQIADRLVVSTRTVSKHLQNVYEKLGVSSRAAAAARLLGED
jgi:DNA-binding CsgD family transcriptional regulator